MRMMQVKRRHRFSNPLGDATPIIIRDTSTQHFVPLH